MERREFVQRSATLAGAATLLGISALEAEAPPVPAKEGEAGPEPAPLAPRLPDAPAPISESEREQRRDKAQRLMKELGISAMLIEPGPSMIYFSGIEWGRSERLFAFILPQTGKGIVVSPAFEEQRAANQVDGRFDIRVWQEEECPETLVAAILKERGFGTGKLAIDTSARTFVFNEMALSAPAMQMHTAKLVVNGCRGIKTAHEIEIMRFANQITLDVYRTVLKTL